MVVDDSYTKLLLHCEGADGATLFIDESGKAVTANGNAQIDTADKKFGSSSALFDGTGDYLSLLDNDDWNFGSSNFTIDLWAKWALDAGSITQLVSQWVDSSHYWTLHYRPGIDTLYFYASIPAGEGGGISDVSIAGIDLLDSLWHHIAIVRNGNDFNLFIDGDKGPTVTDSTAMPDLASILWIGDGKLGTTLYPFKGWIDEVRVSKGIARWTADFTPPTEPYFNKRATSMLKLF